MNAEIEKIFSNGNVRMRIKHLIDLLEAYQMGSCNCTHYKEALRHIGNASKCIEDRGRALMLKPSDDPEFAKDEIEAAREVHRKSIEGQFDAKG